MALKAKLDKLDGLDDAAKALYKQDGEHFILDVEPTDGFALENVTALKTALQRERDSAEEASKKAKAFDGLDPSKAREALEKVEKMRDWTPDEKVKDLLEARTKELAEKLNGEKSELEAKLNTYRTNYEAVTLDAALKDAASKAKFISPALAPKLFRDAVKLHETEQGLLPVVLGKDGKPAQVVENNGTVRFQTIEEYVAEMAKTDEFAPLVAANSATGTAGTKPQADTGSNGSPKSYAIQQAEAHNRLAEFASAKLGK